LQAHVAVAHLAFEFGLGYKCGNRVHDEHVDGAGAYERFCNFQRLLAVVGLRDEEVVNINAEFPGVSGVERVLGIDECGHASSFLRLGDDLQCDGGFARRFGPEDFDNAAAGNSANAESGVE
jgi:hypothetical protein